MRGLDRRIGPGGPHGDPDVGLGQRGCVVDPIADHGDDGAPFLEAGDDLDLGLRQTLGSIVDPEAVGERVGYPLVVAGQQQDPADPERPESRQGLRDFRPERVGHGKEPLELPASAT